MIKSLFNQNWRFLKTKLGTEIQDITQRYKEFQKIDVPHDWLIYNTHQLYEDSCGWYCKKFFVGMKNNHKDDVEWVDANLEKHEHIQIRFDGVYMDCSVYINSKWVGDWKYGYSAFDFDITSYIRWGENEILVQVRHQSPNSRWYSGAGIYRNVWLRVCNEVYLPFDGTYIVSKPVANKKHEISNYEIEIQTEIQTEMNGIHLENYKCKYALYEGEQLICDFGWQQHISEKTVTSNKVKFATVVATLHGIVENPKIWDIESPHCYELHVELYETNAQTLIDYQRITIGFRTMEFDSEKGFFLNGKNVKVHGVCEHHDFGCLGAVFYKEAMRRKFEILRKMGVNAIRTSHNMPAFELMELANEMGFLIVTEAFDMWEKKKTEYDYGRFFKEWAKADVRSWVRRDRNHPSLMLWSIGNEIYDTHASDYGQEITKRLIDYVRVEDPKGNALITIGSNFMPWENARKCADIVKIAGYNYGEKYYDEHHKQYPDWVIYGSETGSIVQSRGVYHFPMSQSVLADVDEQCSALGNSTTSWGAKSVEKCITDDRDATYNFGQFLWTGFDYIGEPTPYHTKNSYFGQIDTAGFPKDSYYVFQAEWTDVKKSPMVHVFPYWDFNEGQMIDVRACTNGAAIELFVNGLSYGKQEIDHIKGLKLVGEWKVPYVVGEILVKAYDSFGNVIATERKHSFTEGVALKVQVEEKEILADGRDLSFLTIEVEDENGYIVENAMNYVEVAVEGEARLLGLDNGDSTDYDQYKTNQRKLFNGKLLAVIGTTKKAGDISVLVTGRGLKPAKINLKSKEVWVPKGISATENINCVAQTSLDTKIVPVRKIEILALDGQEITTEKRELYFEANIYPKDASDQEVVWKVVNDGGIEIEFASLEIVSDESGKSKVKVTAFGDGDFRLRCMSYSGHKNIKTISQLELKAQGLGQAFLNPYGYISAGLYTDYVGEIGNGNEKGIATARDGASGVVYSNIDFGDYGSDEITIDVFALSSDEYTIEFWNGKPGEEESLHLTSLKYQKPSRWNVYQPETWKLPKRMQGIGTIGFLLNEKVHIKGFSFTKYNKSISKLNATECNHIYGDNYNIEATAITNIGNNVTLTFDNFDFGIEGVNSLQLCGKTKHEVNTIHIHFTPDTPEEGETLNRIIEFKQCEDYKTVDFSIETLYGKGKLEFIFLPGSKFDFKEFQFEKYRIK